MILSKLLQSVFFGTLRSIEIERMHDRLWFTVTETLLALAMFRDEFDTTFVVLFISLIFVKCFHWLAADRVEWVSLTFEKKPSCPRLSHTHSLLTHKHTDGSITNSTRSALSCSNDQCAFNHLGHRSPVDRLCHRICFTRRA